MRFDATGAFAHDLRTPLTSIAMVLAIARTIASEGDLTLDDELEKMLRSSISSINDLLDDFHESSRIERNMVTFATAPTDMRAVIEAAVKEAESEVSLGEMLESRIGPWDGPRLQRAIFQLAESANGDGSGKVALSARLNADQITLHISSGSMDGLTREVSTDAGYFFFRAVLIVEAIGGTVVAERVVGGAKLTVSLLSA